MKTKSSQLWLTGIIKQSRQPKSWLKFFHQYLATPKTINSKQLHANILGELQASDFQPEDCLLAAYIFTLLKDLSSASYYFKRAQSGQAQELLLLENLMRKQPCLPEMPEMAILDTEMYQDWLTQKLEWLMFETLQEYLTTPAPPHHFGRQDQQTWLNKYILQFQTKLENLRTQYTELQRHLPSLLQKFSFAKTLLQRYQNLERAMIRFNKTALELEKKIHHTKLMLKNSSFSSQNAYLQLLKLEFQDQLVHLDDQLQIMDKQAYLITPFYAYFTELNQKSIALLIQVQKVA